MWCSTIHRAWKENMDDWEGHADKHLPTPVGTRCPDSSGKQTWRHGTARGKVTHLRFLRGVVFLERVRQIIRAAGLVGLAPTTNIRHPSLFAAYRSGTLLFQRRSLRKEITRDTSLYAHTYTHALEATEAASAQATRLYRYIQLICTRTHAIYILGIGISTVGVDRGSPVLVWSTLTRVPSASPLASTISLELAKTAALRRRLWRRRLQQADSDFWDYLLDFRTVVAAGSNYGATQYLYAHPRIWA